MLKRTSLGRDFQDQLLARLQQGEMPATLYLNNRMSVRGHIIRFDSYVILLDPQDGGPPQMVYKSAVVSVSGPRVMGRGPGGPRRSFGPPRPFDGNAPEGEFRPPPPGYPAPE
jgi:RNA chaperone Hfq